MLRKIFYTSTIDLLLRQPLLVLGIEDSQTFFLTNPFHLLFNVYKLFANLNGKSGENPAQPRYCKGIPKPDS